eukprot:tig00001041_g6569.t1
MRMRTEIRLLVIAFGVASVLAETRTHTLAYVNTAKEYVSYAGDVDIFNFNAPSTLRKILRFYIQDMDVVNSF